LFGKNGIELVKPGSRVGDIRNLLAQRLDLFGDGFDLPLQGRHPFFEGNDGRPGLTVFFVQPFEAFDELFKFHNFLRKVTLRLRSV
jgi:hypothetical protein